MNQECEHFKDVDEDNISPNTKGCEECEKEKSHWVALRMCLVCGHVGWLLRFFYWSSCKKTL
jgi:hypothetical protein